MDSADIVKADPLIDTPHGNGEFKNASRRDSRRERILMSLLCIHGILLLVITPCLYHLAATLNSFVEERVNSCFEGTWKGR
jgi:hypothetical protein